MMAAAAAGRPGPTLASIRHDRLQHLASVRVCGLLTADAQLATTTGAAPHGVLSLAFAPDNGLPYLARLDLGTNPLDHMQCEGHLPYLRAGALVSVAGHALELRTDHGHAALRVVNAHALVIPIDLIPTQPLEG